MSRKKEKRSMADALAGSAEALAFLDEGKAKQSRGEPTEQHRTPPPSPSNQKPKKQFRNQATKDKHPPQRIRMTFRLPVEIANALIDASAERRKRRQLASSQQDIVTEAIKDWLGSKQPRG